LIGYAYVHAVTVPLTIRNQAILLILLVAAAVVFLPITPSESMKPPNADNPVGRIMLLLTTSVGLPYVILSTTSPLLQRWLAHADKDILASRYFALSNTGSLIGLLSYPFLFEWFWSSSEQTQWWSHAFIVYACLGAVAAGMVLVRIPSTEKDEAYGRDPGPAGLRPARRANRHARLPRGRRSARARRRLPRAAGGGRLIAAPAQLISGARSQDGQESSQASVGWWCRCSATIDPSSR
jgi:hypothetical protein